MKIVPFQELFIIRNIYLVKNFTNMHRYDINQYLTENGFSQKIILENPKITVFERLNDNEINKHTEIHFISDSYSKTEYFGDINQ